MKVTMKDIAQALNISINAVSIALNNKTGVSEEMRLTILKTAREMGYLEGKDKYGRNHARANLCVMMQNTYSGDMNFYGMVLYSIVVEARKSSYDVIMNFFDDAQMEVPECVKNYQVSGIITIGKINHTNIRQLKEYHLPLVTSRPGAGNHRAGDLYLRDRRDRARDRAGQESGRRQSRRAA
jgi:DNA-binding LacI/PurR family transcriptional regulator